MCDKPLEVKVVAGKMPPGFGSTPAEMWVKITGADHPTRVAAAQLAAEAVKEIDE